MPVRLVLAVTVLALSAGCVDRPEIQYETDHLRIGTDFEDPVCLGTIEHFEDQVLFVEDRLGLSVDEEIELYWYDSLPPRACRDGADGCTSRSPRRIDSETELVMHELVHAVAFELGVPDELYSEGLAEALNGQPTVFGPMLPTEMVGQDFDEIDYPSAGHFMRWVLEEQTSSDLRTLLGASSESRGRRHAEDAFEDAFSLSLGGAENRFVAEAPDVFPGFHVCDFDAQKLADDVLVMDLELDCDDVETRGVGNMTHSLVLEIADPGEYVVELDEPGELRLRYCHDEPIQVGEGPVIGGLPPIGDFLGDAGTLPATWLPAGVHTVEPLRPGRFRVDVRVSGVEPTQVQVRFHRRIGASPP